MYSIGKRKYHALMLSNTQIYEVKSLCQQLCAGFQTKEICLIGTWAVSGAPSLYSSTILGKEEVTIKKVFCCSKGLIFLVHKWMQLAVNHDRQRNIESRV